MQTRCLALMLWIFPSSIGIAASAPDSYATQAAYADCFNRSAAGYLAIIEPLINNKSAIFGKTTFLEQYYSNEAGSVKAMIVASEIAGAMLEGFDPRNLGASRDGDRPLSDGIIANQTDDGIQTRVGPIGISWKVAAGEVNADALWAVAESSVDRACIRTITTEAEK